MNEISLPVVIAGIFVVLGLVMLLMTRTKDKQVTTIQTIKPENRAAVPNDWFDGISRRIQDTESGKTRKGKKKFRSDLFLTMARRVAEFSPECEQCQLFKQDISNLISDLDSPIREDVKAKRKSDFQSINTILNHLQVHHRLVNRGYYTTTYLLIGSTVGLILGYALGQTIFGIPIGTGIGVIVGAVRDSKVKKESRIF